MQSDSYSYSDSGVKSLVWLLINSAHCDTPLQSLYFNIIYSYFCNISKKTLCIITPIYMYSFHRITVNKKLHPLPSVHLVSMKDSDDTAKKIIFQAFFIAKIIWHIFDILKCVQSVSKCLEWVQVVRFFHYF